MRVALIVTLAFLVAGSAMAQTKTTESGYLASASKSDLQKAISYLAAGDRAACMQMIDSNRVFPLKGGIKVYLVDTSIWAGLVKIRPAGKTVEFWTPIEAVN